MDKIIVRHRVADFGTWLQGFLAHEAVRVDNGFAGHLVLRDEADPNVVTVVLSVRDSGRAKAFLGAPQLAEAMARAGVQGPPEFYFCEQAGERAY